MSRETRPPDGQQPCPDALELAAFLDDRLSDEARGALEAHLAECPACREAVSDVRAFPADPDDAPPEVVRAARALVGERLVLRRVGGWGLAAAASIGVCFIGFRIGVGTVAAPREGPEHTLVAEMTFGVFGSIDDDGLIDFLALSSKETLP